MYYDDEARRFNFLSGLVLGAVLGTGLGLLAGPAARPKILKHRARRWGLDRTLAGAARRRATEGTDRVRAATRIMGDLARRH